MTDIAAWLLQQIAEDERVAQAASPPWHPWSDPLLPERAGAVAWGEDVDGYVGGTWGTHAAVWNPWRVLAECEAKRRIVGECVAYSYEEAGRKLGLATLRFLALPFADRPGYDEVTNLQIGPVSPA